MATHTSTHAAVSSQTLPNNLGNVINIPAPVLYTVTYKFSITTSSNVAMPYAVEINGVVHSSYKSKPGRVVCNGVAEIKAKAPAGAKVALYLKSDAHPDYRKTPVYAVTVGSKNIEVRVHEKTGRHPDDTDTPVLQSPQGGPSTLDVYKAVLTGNIWMQISHAYIVSEIPALLPAGTRPEVAAAVRSIYAPLMNATLQIHVPASGTNAAAILRVQFMDSNNPRENIGNYDLLRDGLPRVHPAGYAALFTAAIDNGITSLRVTSCWRPMLGSIAHRAGLGLDVDYVGQVRMNRQELRAQAASGAGNRNDNDNDNVTAAEVSAFKNLEQAIVDRKRAANELEAAQKALKSAEKSGQGVAEAQQRVKDATDAAGIAQRKVRTAQETWDTERKKGEPSAVRQFRLSLLQCSCVGQLFDPWYIYKNARGEGEANMQTGPTTSLERLHAHHLHVTVHEPKIL